MRASPVFAITLVIAIFAFIQPAMAFTEMAIPFITTCDTIFMQPTASADATIIEFNNANIAKTSLETLNIDFPVFADGAHLGPTTGAAAIDGLVLSEGTASVLPFGPVSLAFPSIAQTAEEACSYQRTYFFADTAAL